MALVATTPGSHDTSAVFRDLREALAAAQVDADAYAKTKEQELEALARNTRSDLRAAKAELGELQGRLEAQAAVLEQEREIAALERSRAELEPAVHRRRREAARRGDADLEGLRADLRRFRSFGLDFEGTNDGALQLGFRLLDRREPDRKFCVSVVVNDRDCYEVTASYPTLPRPRLATLVDDVNRTNDFSLFVRRLRKEFLAIIAEE